MNERLLALPFNVQDASGVSATDAAANVKVPFNVTPVGASICLDKVSGSPTDVLVDFNDDGTEIAGFGSISLGATAGAGAQVKTPHLGGAVAVPAQIAKDSVISMDLKFTDGTSPKANVTGVLWVLPGEG